MSPAYHPGVLVFAGRSAADNFGGSIFSAAAVTVLGEARDVAQSGCQVLEEQEDTSLGRRPGWRQKQRRSPFSNDCCWRLPYAGTCRKLWVGRSGKVVRLHLIGYD